MYLTFALNNKFIVQLRARERRGNSIPAERWSDLALVARIDQVKSISGSSRSLPASCSFVTKDNEDDDAGSSSDNNIRDHYPNIRSNLSTIGRTVLPFCQLFPPMLFFAPKMLSLCLTEIIKYVTKHEELKINSYS